MKNNIRARYISILLSAVLIGGCVLTGCGGDDTASLSDSSEISDEDEANAEYEDELNEDYEDYEDEEYEDEWADEDGYWAGEDGTFNEDVIIDEDGWIDEDGNEIGTDSEGLSGDASATGNKKSGSSDGKSGKTKSTGKGTYYDEAVFVDSSSNIPTLRSIIPRGWTTSAYLEQVYDVSSPLRGISTATSADGKSKISFYASASIAQMTASNWETYQSGSVNTTNYQLCLDYMDAPTWSDYTANNDLQGGKYIDGEEIDSADVSKARDSYYNSQIKPYESYFSQAGATIADYGATISDRTYELDDGSYAEIYCMVTYHDINETFTYGWYTNYRYWQPYTFVSIAPDKATLEKQKDSFEMFIANGKYAPELKYVNTQLQNKITAAMQERNNKMFEVTNQAVSEAYDSYDSSDSSASDTNDRVAEMWDDAILDQDNYHTSDGSDVKVSTEYSNVYDMGGGSVYASKSASDDPGIGYTPMTPSY